jgi:hypothetical protein
MQKTVSINGFEFKVDFDYQPYEPTTRHYPGCSESVEINEIWDSDGDKLKEWAVELLEMNDIERVCHEAVQVDQEEAQLAKEEAKQEAWEARQEMNLLNL